MERGHTGAAMTDKPVIARCIWCDGDLYASPTRRGWINGLHHDEGICFECIERLYRDVIMHYKMNSKKLYEIKTGDNS